ncbi:MAG: hypothetical protein Tsb0027_11450 [Wenzhouxiangellaceae bacterium]
MNMTSQTTDANTDQATDRTGGKSSWLRWLGWSLLALLLLLLVLLLGGRWWLLHTASGAGFVLDQAQRTLQPALQIKRSSGNIGQGLRLSGVVFSNAASSTSIEQIELQAKLRLLPTPRLIIQRLYLDGVKVSVLPSDEPPPETLPDLRSPLAIKVRDLRLRQLSLRLPDQPASAEPLQLDQLQAEFAYADSLTVSRLQAQAYAAELTLRGTAALQPPYTHDVLMSLQDVGKQWLPALQQAAFEMHSEGDLDALSLSLQGRDGLPLRADVQLYQLMQQPRWELQLTSSEALQWPLPSAGDASDAPMVAVRDVELSSSGRADDYQLSLRSALQQPSQLAGDWQLQLRGDGQQLALQTLQGDLLQGSVQAQGSYQLAPPMQQGELRLQLSQLHLADMLADADLPNELPPVSGGVNLRLAEQQLLLQDLLLQAAGLPWQLRGEASYGLLDERLSGRLNWQALDWPPGSAERAEWRSSEGVLQASGSLQNLQLDIDSDLAGSTIPPMQLQLQASVLQQQSLQLQQLLMQTLGGQARLSGSATWGEALQAQLDYQLDGLDPGQFWGAYPGDISASGSVQASAAADFSAPAASVQIDQLSGSLRGQPISGSGSLRYADQRFVSDGLKLESGAASLSLRGDDQQLLVELDIPSAGQLYAAAAGNVQASISMQALPGSSLRLDRGQLQLQLEGSGLGWQQRYLETLSMQADLRLAETGLLGNVDVSLQQLSDGSNKLLRQASANLVSDAAGQRLQLAAGRAGTRMQLTLNGASQGDTGFAPWQPGFAWRGELLETQLEDRQLGVWRQSGPEAFSLIDGVLTLQQTCLRGSDEVAGSALCFAATQTLARPDQHAAGAATAGESSGRLQASADIERLPVALLTRITGAAVSSDQLLSGHIELALADALEQLAANVVLTPGRLSLDGDSEAGVDMQQGEARLQLVDDAITGDLLLRLHQVDQSNGQNEGQNEGQNNKPNSGEIKADWQFGPLASEQPELSGDLYTSLPDLSLLQSLVPTLNELGGSLNMHAQFKGPLPQPLIALDVNLHDGRIVYAPVGLALRDINLQGQSQPGQPFQGTGGMRAGDGQASMQFRLAPLKRTAELSIQGENLQLADSQVLQLRVSPDLKLSAAADGYRINGELLVPQALLQPPKQVATQQRESADVVVVGVEQPPAQQPGIDLNGKLKLVLGDDVRVRADVASTRLQGAVDLLWEGHPVPQANGSIALIDGKVQAYGQTLILRDSRVSYNDAPADNPRLDIYAVRRIFGDPAVSEAGVAVTGRAQQPDIRLFTNPASNEESALAYIATGSNFDHGNGEGALNLGLYLFPRLFVSYGVGLFDNGNVTNARYEFSDNWNVTLESGQRDSAVQINWRKNRD